MTVILVQRDDTVVVRDVGRWRRACARLRGRRLDADLGRGVSPDYSVEHSLRAEWLAMREQRLLTAAEVDRVISEALSLPRSSSSVAPPMSRRVRSAVHANAYELSWLARKLSSYEPVSPRGLALARLLTTDGAGPLHYGSSAEVLRRECELIVEALDPATERR